MNVEKLKTRYKAICPNRTLNYEMDMNSIVFKLELISSIFADKQHIKNIQTAMNEKIERLEKASHIY